MNPDFLSAADVVLRLGPSPLAEAPSVFGLPSAWYPEVARPDFSRADALAIIYRDYWEPTGCDFWPAWLALWVLDVALEQSPSVARKGLQRAMGVTPDGQIRDATLAAGVKAEPGLLGRLLEERLAYCEVLPVASWAPRLFQLVRECLARLCDEIESAKGVIP